MFKISLLSVFIIACANILLAQKEQAPVAYIKLVAQYNPTKNAVELRFLSEKKSVLAEAENHGFIIERAAVKSKIHKASDLRYKKIGKVTAYTKSKWKSLIQQSDDQTKGKLKAAQAFYESIHQNHPIESAGDFENFYKQKKAEDLEFALLLLSAMQNEDVALALGIGLIDKSVKQNKKYVYRARIPSYKGAYQLESVPYVITTSHHSSTPKRDIEVIEGDGQLTFTWEENDMISGVIVDRKNNSGQYEPLLQVPKYSLNQVSLENGFQDTALVNYQTYEYKFYGLTPFGKKVLFGKAKGMPRDLTPPKAPIISSAKQITPNTIQIKWTFPAEITDLKGFYVKRGTRVNGEFKRISSKILAPKTRYFADKDFNPYSTNFYVIEAVDTADNHSTSFAAFATIIDTIAPSKPKIISAKMDSFGIVTIQIAKNPERDLMGYRIYWANNSTHEFSVADEHFKKYGAEVPAQLTFKDTVTLKSLTPDVYYQVKALDYHYNQSEFSDFVKVARIDTISPTTPVFKNVLVQENAIKLSFALSQSTDVKTHILYRKTNQQSNWEKIASLTSNQTQYIDKNLKKGEDYYYAIRAMDIHHLYSEYSLPVHGRPYDTGKRPTIQNFKVNKKEKHYTFNWSYPEAQKNTYFVLYRTNKKGALVQYKRTTQNQLTITASHKKNSFALRAFSNGGQSPLSNTIILP